MVGKVSYTISKKDQILSWFGALRFEEHTYRDKGYEFLEADSIFLTVYSPNNDIKLSIELGEIFTLFFGGLQIKHEPNEVGFSLLCNEVKGILSALLSVYVLELEDGTQYELAETFELRNVKEISVLIPAFKKFRLKNAKLRLCTWR